MKKLVLFVLFLTTIPAFSQLKGTALLPGQSDHAGIKVKFIAVSTTAVTDSVYTDPSGTYTANISNGLYKVNFSKKGFRNLRLDNGNTILLTNTTVLDTSILLTGITHNVGGSVYGLWETADTYVLKSDVTIPADSILRIEPGVIVLADGNFGITAEGSLFADGLEDNKIWFTTASSNPNPTSWKGITVHRYSSITHCLIEYCTSPIINGTGGSSAVKSDELRYFGKHGVETLPGGFGSEVAGCKIHDYYGIGAHAVTGTNTVVRCSQFYNGRFGAHIEGSTYLDNNLVYNMSEGYAISISGGGPSSVLNNVIHSAVTGIEIGSAGSASFTGEFRNNTIYNNHTGVQLTGSVMPYFTANLVVSNTLGIRQTDAIGQPTIAYCLVWNNIQGDYQNVNQLALGQKINKNVNGDSVDAYFNLSQDPLFWFAPFTTENSPVKNAGGPSSPGAGDYSIGFYLNGCPALQVLTGIEEKQPGDKQLKAYPNPFDEKLTIEIPSGFKSAVLQVFDITGKICHTETSKSVNAINLNLQHLGPGVYILKVTTPKNTGYSRIIKE